MSENDIIARIKAGDDKELGRVYEKYRQEFISWAIRTYSCTVDEAKEVYQLAIVIFYENIFNGRLTTMTSSVKSYLFAIGKNKVLEQKKFANRFTHNLEGDMNIMSEDKPVIEVEQEEATLKLVEQCLHLLGEPCKGLLEMYYYRRSNMTEIAESLGYKNTDTAKNQKYKCMKRLKKLFEERTLNTV